MQRVAGDGMARHAEFFQQLLHGGDFVGLLVDLDMRQHQRRIGGQRAENLFCLDAVEVVETSPEHLAIECHDACAEFRLAKVQACGMFAKRLFNVRLVQPLQNVADRRMGRRSLAAYLEGLAQLLPMHHDECADAAIGVRAAHNRQN